VCFLFARKFTRGAGLKLLDSVSPCHFFFTSCVRWPSKKQSPLLTVILILFCAVTDSFKVMNISDRCKCLLIVSPFENISVHTNVKVRDHGKDTK
jgi:hypothetical protein